MIHIHECLLCHGEVKFDDTYYITYNPVCFRCNADVIKRLLYNNELIRKLKIPIGYVGPFAPKHSCNICHCNIQYVHDEQVCETCLRKYVIPNLKIIKQMLALERL